MRKVPPSVIPHILSELIGLEKAARSLRVAELAELYGVKTKTITNIACKNGQRCHAERRDKGKSICPEHIIKLVAAKVNVGINLKGQVTNPIRNAMEMVAAEGIDIPVSYAQMCILLQNRGYSIADLTAKIPTRRLISAYPNQAWLFDVSNCLQWHLDKKTGLSEEWDFELKYYKNKAMRYLKDKRQVLYRYVIIDHCSGAFYFRYFYSSGERAEDGVRFFYDAFSTKNAIIAELAGINNSKYAFCGVPDMIISDKGSILRRAEVINLMSALGVEINTHAAGAPWAKGAVECLMNIIGTGFEPVLKYKRPSSLEELNKWALAWCIKRNCADEFRNHTDSRHALWLQGISGHLRKCPEYSTYTQLQHLEPITRKVTIDSHVRYNGQTYYVNHPDATGRTVYVSANAYDYPAVIIKCPWDGSVLQAEPLEYDQYNRLITPANVNIGEYRALPKSKRQKAKAELEQIASEYGIDWKGNGIKRQAVAPKRFDMALPAIITRNINEISDEIAHLHPIASEITVPDVNAPIESVYDSSSLVPADSTPISIDEVLRQLVNKYGRVTPAQKCLIEQYYPNGIPATYTIDDILESIGGVNDRSNLA